MARDRRRRRLRTLTAAGACTGDGEPPPTRTTSIHDYLPDELLEQVLLRVRTPFCLFRAMATCKLWRRVIAGDDGFLHRVCSLHRPNHLLGHYIVNTTEPGFNRTVPEFVPFPARPALHLRQRLSLADFLIDGEHMLKSAVLTDSRGGLLAFVHRNWFAVVCDPWTRQYRVLDEFAWPSVVEDPEGTNLYHCLGAFILDAGDEKCSLMSSFRVLCVCLITDLMEHTTTAEACVFSAGDNGWTRSTSSNVYRIVRNMDDMDKRFVGRAGGSIFFSAGADAAGHVLLVIDEATGNFSTISLPWAPDVYNFIHVDRGNLRVVNEVSGSGLVCIIHLVKDDLKVLKVTRAHGGWECMVESSVDLCQLANIESSCANRPSWCFLEYTATTAAAATLVLGASSSSSSTLFFLDVQTMKLQRATKKMRRTMDAKRVFPYELPWPQTIN